MTEEKKTVKLFSIAAFLNDLGHYMITPIWPMFITTIIGAPVSFLGIIEGLGEAMAALIKYPAGIWADKTKKKPLIALGYLLPAVARIGYAFSSTIAWILPLHSLDRIGKGIREPARDGYLTQTIPKEKRGESFGILKAFDRAGAAMGPLIAFALFGLIGYQNLILLAVIPSALAVLLIILFVKETKKDELIKKEKFEFNKMSPNFKNAIFISGIFGLSWFSISFMILYSTQILNYSITSIAIAVFLHTVVSSFASFKGGKLSDKLGRKKVLIFSMALFSIMCFGFILSSWNNVPFLVFGLFAIYGLHYGMLIPLQNALIGDLSTSKVASSAQGAYQFIFGISAMLASIMAGLIWEYYAPTGIFYYGFIVSVIAIILFSIRVKEN
ncbi:MAG: MFS transporter [Candidatus Diapherotrites archaeon]|nr:MFS transporter [Candidatus Diapherotrites archaeon]